MWKYFKNSYVINLEVFGFFDIVFVFCLEFIFFLLINLFI